MSYKTTKKDFAEFKKEAEYWIEYFGLKNWQVTFSHKIMNDARADCVVDMSGRICVLGLAIPFQNIPIQYEIKKCAFHEVCEILLCPLDNYAKFGYGSQLVEEKTHDIIRRLENTIFKEHRG